MNDNLNTTLDEREKTLKHIITAYKKACIGFSGGVDSTLLLYLASQLIPVVAVTVDGPMVSREDIREAKSFTQDLDNTEHIIEPVNVLDIPEFKQNTAERCYFCKREIFSRIGKIAAENECDVIFDGANIDDLSDYRPGMKATKELGIVSPFLEAGLTKDDIYYLSKKYDLPTKSKPAAACLASRIPTGEEIDANKLKKIEEGEKFLKTLGFKQVRLRLRDGKTATIECLKDDFEVFNDHFGDIKEILRKEGIQLNPQPQVYQQGSMNYLN